MTVHAQTASGGATNPAMRQEHWFIFGNLFAALSAGALASWSTPMMLAVLYVDIWLLANPHIVATYTRIGAMSSRARLRWVLIVIAPILVLAGLTFVALAYEAAGLFALYFALQAFHVTRQSYGIARRYDRRLQVPLRNLPYLLIYLLPAWGYLHRSAQAPDSFLSYPIWLPPVPQELAFAAGIAAAVGSLCWFACLGYARGAQQADGPFNSFVLSHLIVSLVGYVWISDITVGWLVVNVWHNIQYLMFVYRQRQPGTATGKDSEASDSDSARRKSLAEMLRPPVTFFLACVICGALLYAAASRAGESLLWLGLPTILIAHFTLNFHHYLADGVIWKRRRAGRSDDIS
ncbi:hypothetical protein SAMN05518845_108310 [Variovorax sp. YR750]|uniref:hypothetical protein n=1 Tax=Variovorax sp. YR750 TaxID=1884384 RepID=UPI0008B8A7A1|nr:hypothetical protein [Variovorax sp. YR750]SEL57101.1 hypothetical protein SAMN05518845_108310 [Variovorax sp. YR750]